MCHKHKRAVRREKKRFFKVDRNRVQREQEMNDMIEILKIGRGTLFNEKEALEYAKARVESKMFYVPRSYFEHDVYLTRSNNRRLREKARSFFPVSGLRCHVDSMSTETRLV